MFVAFTAFAVNACESLNSCPLKGYTNANRKTPFACLALRFINDDAVARKLKKVEEKVEEEKVEIVAWKVFLAWPVSHQYGRAEARYQRSNAEPLCSDGLLRNQNLIGVSCGRPCQPYPLLAALRAIRKKSYSKKVLQNP